MTERDGRQGFSPASGGPVTPTRSGCLGEDGDGVASDGATFDGATCDVDDGHEYSTAEDVVQVNATPR